MTMLTKLSRQLVVVTAFALLVNLFLAWRDAPVQSQYLDESGGASALNGWGVLIPPLLFVFLLVELFLGRPRLSLALATGVAAVTFVEFFTGTAQAVKIGDVVQTATEATLWPAFAGLALAAGLVLATIPRIFARPPVMLPLPPLPASLAARFAAER